MFFTRSYQAPSSCREQLVRIREATEEDALAIARVQVDSWRTTYKGIVPDSYIATLNYEQREQKWREFFSTAGRTPFAYVAEDDDGQVVGFASGGSNREGDRDYDGELYAIYLLKEYQRRGIGHMLVSAVVKRLLQEGMTSMLVWVLADNPSCAFYESLGGKLVSEKEIIIGGATLIEVAYGWLNLQDLVDQK